MANRHKSQKKSGALSSAYAGGNSNVAKEARSSSDGFKGGGKVHGKKAKMRRARGGRTGGSPFSSAKTSEKGNLT